MDIREEVSLVAVDSDSVGGSVAVHDVLDALGGALDAIDDALGCCCGDPSDGRLVAIAVGIGIGNAVTIDLVQEERVKDIFAILEIVGDNVDEVRRVHEFVDDGAGR